MPYFACHALGVRCVPRAMRTLHGTRYVVSCTPRRSSRRSTLVAPVHSVRAERPCWMGVTGERALFVDGTAFGKASRGLGLASTHSRMHTHLQVHKRTRALKYARVRKRRPRIRTLRRQQARSGWDECVGRYAASHHDVDVPQPRTCVHCRFPTPWPTYASDRARLRLAARPGAAALGFRVLGLRFGPVGFGP